MRFSLFAAAVLCVSSLAAHADTVYTYTGANYAGASGAFTTSEHVSGTITLAAPLAANLSSVHVTPTDFSIMDGLDTFTRASSNAGFTYFSFSTDGSGSITGYQFQIFQGSVPAPLAPYVTVRAYPGYQTSVSGFAGFSTAATTELGTLSVNVSAAVTPEPSSLALLGTGLLGIFGVMKRQRCES